MEKFEIEPYNDESVQLKFAKEEAYIRAKKRLEKIVGFYWHLAVYIVINLVLITIIVTHRDEGESIWNFGTFATAFFWGIGLMFHFLGVFGPNFLFGKKWEERKIREFMEKEGEKMKRFE